MIVKRAGDATRTLPTHPVPGEIAVRMTLRSALVVVSLALSVVIGLVIARGGAATVGGGGGDDDRLLIGLSLDTLKEERWKADSAMFKAAAEKLGAEVLVQSANSDDAQ